MGILIYHFAAHSFTEQLPGYDSAHASAEGFAAFLRVVVEQWLRGLSTL